MPRVHHRVDRLAAETALLGTALIALLLLGAWAGLWAGIPISRWQLWLALAVTAGVAIARSRALRQADSIAAAALCLVWLGAAAMLGRAIFDTSWDGAAYHQLAISALRDGWNPTVMPHLRDWMAQTVAAGQQPAFLIDAIGDDGVTGDPIWPNHFPKGAWVIGATIASATGSLGAAKALQGLMPLLALAALFRGFRVLGLSMTAAGWFALAAVASPPVVVQLSSNYVDGLLACALAMGVGAAFAWLAERRLTDLFVLLIALVLATNLKFTGAVYAGLLVAAVLGFAAWRGWRPARSEWRLLAGGAAALLLASAQTYGHNLLTHGHPLYPVGVVDIIRTQAADAFLDLDRFDKLARSLFQVPSNRLEQVPELQFVWPVPAHFASLIQSPDTRFAGFGSLFGWTLLPALACLCAGLFGVGTRGWRRQPALLLVIGWALLSFPLNPEMWWARYVPQLWMLPVFAAALAWAGGWRRLAWTSVLLALLSSALTAAYAANRVIADERRIATLWQRSVQAGQLAVLDVGPRSPGLPALAAHAREHGLPLVKLPAAQCEVMRLGIVAACLPASR